MAKNSKTSEELLKECDVLLEECRLITDSIWAQLGIRRSFGNAEELLIECGGLIEEAHLINDAIEGWLGTKRSFKDEILGNMK